MSDIIQIGDGLLAQVPMHFAEFKQEMAELLAKAETMKVTSVDQVDLMAESREVRLMLARIRIDADKKGKELKSDALEYGQAIDAMRREIREAIQPVEKILQANEDFAKIQEEKRLRLLATERRSQLLEYVDHSALDFYDVRNMPEDQFQKLIEDCKVLKANNEKIAAEKAAADLAEKKRVADLEAKLEIERKERAAEKLVADRRLETERKARLHQQNLKDKRNKEIADLKKRKVAEERIARIAGFVADYPEIEEPTVDSIIDFSDAEWKVFASNIAGRAKAIDTAREEANKLANLSEDDIKLIEYLNVCNSAIRSDVAFADKTIPLKLSSYFWGLCRDHGFGLVVDKIEKLQ